MKKTYEDFVKLISDEEFIEYVLIHSAKEVKEHFDIGGRIYEHRMHELGLNKNKSKFVYINDGINNKRIIEGAEIPNGFTLGKLPFSRNWDETRHKHHTDETKIKISESKKRKQCGKKNPFYGKNHTEETKEILREKHTGRTPYNKGKKLTEEELKERDKKIIEKYGSLENFYSHRYEHWKNSITDKYGSWDKFVSDANTKKSATCMERYGIPYFCLDKSCRRAGNGSDSGPNLKFKELLIKYNLFESDEENREYVIGKKQYDFKIGGTLIEIDPSITHNSTVDMFGKNPKQPEYHLEKTTTAIEAGFKCIHIFDWDDEEKIVYRFLCDHVVYARKCSIKEIEDKIIVNKFLNENHLQGSCRGASVAIGLYYNDELLQVMTFGKPRYNKKYEYELLRLCSKLGTRVVGGSERLFKYFLKKYSPSSIISYCDNAKFTGDIYGKLGFSLKTYGKPSKHWFNLITGQHVTDNLLRERGFDQLFNANYGKGTDNEELMIEHGFVEVFDCGQSVYEYIV